MEPLISVRDLNKSFFTPGGEIHVLKDINIDLNKGEMAAVMGPSGVGKSTLLHILGVLDRPSSGKILYEKQDVFSMSSDVLANFRNRTIGFIFQFHHLLPEFNAVENTMMPALISGINRKEAYKKAEAILAEVGLSDRLMHKAGELSGGEQQRVAVARALILEPTLVLADEPTGNLDTQTGKDLFGLLSSLNKRGNTFLIVTHNKELANNCNRTITMLDGRVI